MIRHVVLLSLILAIWVVSSAVFFFFTDMAPGALVIYPSGELKKNLPEDVRVLDWRHNRLVLTSDQPGYVGRLYSAGAWLVLPARKNGCVDLRSPGGYPSTRIGVQPEMLDGRPVDD